MTQVFYVVHVASIICLIGTAFSAVAAPIQSRRKKTLMFSGIASLLAMLSGFGLAGMLKHGFPLWIVVKIICWLIISMLIGFFFRKPEISDKLFSVVLFLGALALAMVYLVR